MNVNGNAAASWPSIAVLGAGAVGCYFGGMLARAGAPVTLIGRPAHVDAIRRDGLVIERVDGREVIAIGASTDVAAARDADVVLVCVKSSDTADAARELAPHLASNAVVVSLQNGVDNADRLREVIDIPVFAAVVYVGCYIVGPGIVRHTGRGDLVLGAARREFERAGVACPISPDIDAALWTKLVINCATNAISAVGRARYGRMLREPAIWDTMQGAVREAVAVARASGISLDEKALIQFVWQVGSALSEQYSSTAQDVLRGKRTEIDSLNGYIARRAQALGVPAPINRTLHALVKLREAGDDLID
jgi:2-dehydropantoate 2-reductase